ncbi:MAG: T9SS type A sorting domain-containing protein, partial [Bacteroidia bacterium]|nr:T9SS type A sorting domain-containing protein [Bacteroidia bacterium]
ATYDAYGTLKTPFGTYNDVIRIKITETGNTDVLYFFYQCSPTFKKLAHYVYDGSTTKTVYFYQFTSGPSNVAAINNEQIAVYPNPVKAGNEIVVNNLTPESQVELLNLMGETISTTTGANPVFSTEALPAGMYLVRVVTGNKTSVSKIVVQ